MSKSCSYWKQAESRIIKVIVKTKSPGEKLDVALLHQLVIDGMNIFTAGSFSLNENVSYIRNLPQGLEEIRKGEFQGMFLLPPVTVWQVQDVVEKGEMMPHKSTDFFPKLKSGIVMDLLDR